MVACLKPPSILTLIPLVDDFCSHLHGREAGVVGLNLLRQGLLFMFSQAQWSYSQQDGGRAQETVDMQADCGMYHAHATTATRLRLLLLLLLGTDGWSSWNGDAYCTAQSGL